MRTTLLVMTAVVLLAAQPLWADVVTLKNGDHYTGEVVQMDGGKLTFKTAAGTLVIDRKEVVSLRMDRPLLVTLEGKDAVSLAVTTDGKGAFKFDGKDRTLASIASILAPPKKLSELDYWSGNVGLSVTGSDGNARTLSVHGEVNLVRDQSGGDETLRNKAVLGLKYDYGMADGDETLNAGWGGARLDVYFFQGLSVYLSGAASFDEQADLDMKTQVDFGLAWGTKFSTCKYSTWLGFSYITHAYNETPSRREADPYLAIGEEITCHCEFTGFDFHLKGVIYPNLNDIEKFLAEVEGDASRKLDGGWFLKFSVKYVYNSDPAVGKEKGDVTYAASLVLKF